MKRYCVLAHEDASLHLLAGARKSEKTFCRDRLNECAGEYIVHCVLSNMLRMQKLTHLLRVFFFLRLLLCLPWSWLFCLPFFYECRTLAGSVHVWKLLEVGRTLAAMDIACQYRNTPAISRPYQKAIQKMDSRFSATRRVSDD